MKATFPLLTTSSLRIIELLNGLTAKLAFHISCGIPTLRFEKTLFKLVAHLNVYFQSELLP